MARISISDSHGDDRRLLKSMLAELGHEPITVRVPAPEHLTNAEILIVDPATPVGAVMAQAATIAAPSLPLICTTWDGPPAELAELGVMFVASLAKPLALEQLRGAIDLALRIRRIRQIESDRVTRHTGRRAA